MNIFFTGICISDKYLISLKTLEPESKLLDELNQKIIETEEKLILALEEENNTLRDWLKGYLTIIGDKDKIKKN